MRLIKGKNDDGQRFYSVEHRFIGVNGDAKVAKTTFYLFPDDTRDLIARQLMSMRVMNRQWEINDKTIDLTPDISEQPI